MSCSATSASQTAATPPTATCRAGRSSGSRSPSRSSGGRRVAILDELSTGLDPQARRETWAIESIRDQGVTVLLVTHLMEEAEHLADRVAVFSDGRVVALDTPAGIVSLVDLEQRLRFRPSVQIEDGLLTDLPEVDEWSGPVSSW